MLLANAIITFLLILMLSFSSRGYSTPGVERNFTTTTTGSPWLRRVTKNHPRPQIYPHPSRSPWVKRATKKHLRPHPHPRPPGCRSMPWICRKGPHPPGARMRCCRNQCVDVSSDINHCGLCGIRCPFTWECCRGFCVNTKVNPFNCGKCGNKCPWGTLCVYGMCGYSEPKPLPPWPWPHPHPHPHPRPRPHPHPHPHPHPPPPPPWPRTRPFPHPPVFPLPPRPPNPWLRHPPESDNLFANGTSPSA